MNKGLFISIELQVSAESNAEKLGVRMGDIILSVNGEDIATAVEVHFLSNHVPYKRYYK
jgi:S1-C subfamily serine protease